MERYRIMQGRATNTYKFKRYNSFFSVGKRHSFACIINITTRCSKFITNKSNAP